MRAHSSVIERREFLVCQEPVAGWGWLRGLDMRDLILCDPALFPSPVDGRAQNPDLAADGAVARAFLATSRDEHAHLRTGEVGQG